MKKIIEPSLPLMKLRRENVGMYAKSCFQNKLCDVLYEGSSISNTFYMLNDDVLGFLKAEKESFLNEVVVPFCFFFSTFYNSLLMKIKTN